MDTYHFTEDDVRTMVKQVLEQFDGTGWDYLAKQFPILLDDKLPAMDKVNLDMHETCSFATQYYVGFSESRALKQITDYYSEKKLELGWGELFNNIKNILVHEYGHILLEHVFEKPMTKQLDAEAQVITAEIETNRGIPKFERAKYFDEVIIADDKDDYKSVQPYITHKAVFDEVKRLWQNHKNQQPKQEPQKDECSDSGGGGDNNEQKDEEQTGSNNESKTTPTEQKSEQDSEQKQDEGEKQVKQPDHVGTMVQAMRDSQSNDNAPQKELLSELGLQASDDFRNGDINERLSILVELEQNNEIKKTLAKIKGSLAGELSKEKIGTYSRPSRKTGEDGMMRKGTKRGATKRPNILIALDESGSMNSTAVKTAATAIKLISRTIGRNRSDITICSFSYGINREAKLKNYQEVVDSYRPGGGTSFSSVIDRAKRLGCDVVICIGDGGDVLPNETYGIKWLDVLITSYHMIEQVKRYEYSDKDRETGRRETLWLGSNKRRIEQFASDM